METKIKYLGEYYIDYIPCEDNEEESNAVLINVDDVEDIYETELFMRHNGIIEGIEELGEIHGIMGETNTSSIILKWDDSCDGGKLWRIY